MPVRDRRSPRAYRQGRFELEPRQDLDQFWSNYSVRHYAFPSTNRQERVNSTFAGRAGEPPEQAIRRDPQELVNSTFAGRAKQARGINSENSLAYRIFVLECSYIWPHGGMGGRTPAEAAGIKIRGHDRRLMPFQNAAVAA